MNDDAPNPCVRYGCDLCCVETRMTLTGADVRRLEEAGLSGFSRSTPSGDLQLRNRGGACVFLAEGACAVYGIRPEGCRLYPLVLDLGRDRVVRDALCPYREEFPVTPNRETALRLSVARETAEARTRSRRMDD